MKLIVFALIVGSALAVPKPDGAAPGAAAPAAGAPAAGAPAKYVPFEKDPDVRELVQKPPPAKGLYNTLYFPDFE